MKYVIDSYTNTKFYYNARANVKGEESFARIDWKTGKVSVLHPKRIKNAKNTN